MESDEDTCMKRGRTGSGRTDLQWSARRTIERATLERMSGRARVDGHEQGRGTRKVEEQAGGRADERRSGWSSDRASNDERAIQSYNPTTSTY